MKKNILKRIFVKIIKSLGFEIIDQNEFRSPTLNKDLNQQLSSINKSIVLPLGEVNLTRKISSLLIIFRTNSNIEIWDQNKKRIFEKDKIEYIKRSLNSLIKAVKNLKENYNSIKINIKIVDDNSTKENLSVIKSILDKSKENFEIINHNHSEHLNVIKEQKSKDTFSNLSSLLKSFEIGKNDGEDLIYFIEDDYLHFRSSLEEMVGTYERIASQLNKEIIICPADYPYLYTKADLTQNFLGENSHWRKVDETLCTFLTSRKIIEKHWDRYLSMCKKEHAPFEKPLHEIYKEEICISPIPSLAIHFTNINSIFGLSPNVDWRQIWDENNL